MYLPQGAKKDNKTESGVSYELQLETVSQIRQQLTEWRPLALRGEGGVSRVTMELLNHWRREGREQPLFFAQLEAVETIVFLNEARRDFRQGIDIQLDEPGDEKKKEGYTAFRRLCCKMATGHGQDPLWPCLRRGAY